MYTLHLVCILYIAHGLIFFFVLVAFLADLYDAGESTYLIEDGEVTSVVVDRKRYVLSPEGMQHFKQTHDDWEMKVCKEHPYDPFIGGMSCHFDRIKFATDYPFARPTTRFNNYNFEQCLQYCPCELDINLTFSF